MQKICGTGKMCFNLKQDSDPGSSFKILICRIRIRIRPKMDRIWNPGYGTGNLLKLGKKIWGK